MTGDEADLSPQSAVRIKIHEALPALPFTVRRHGVVLRIGTSVRVLGFLQHCS